MQTDLRALFDRLLPDTLEPFLRPLLAEFMPPEDGERFRLGSVGRFRGRSVPDLMTAIHLQKWKGAVVLAEDDVARVFYVRDGDIIGVSSNVLFERLGRVLHKGGVLSKDDSSLLVETEETQGVARAAALLSDDAAHWGLERRVWEVGAALYYVRHGWWMHVQGTPDLSALPDVKVDPIQLAMEGLRRYDEWRNGSSSESHAEMPATAKQPESTTIETPEPKAVQANLENLPRLGPSDDARAEADAIMRMLGGDA